MPVSLCLFHLSTHLGVFGLKNYLLEIICHYLLGRKQEKANRICEKIFSLFPQILEYFVTPSFKNINAYSAMVRL